MITKLVLLTITLFTLPFLGLVSGRDKKPNPHVKVDVSVEPTSLKPGAMGEIRVQFHPVDGIHITTVPPTELIFNEGSPLTLVGDPVVPMDSTTGYLDASKPLAYAFAVSRTALQGSTNVSGTLVYYFCSDEEGWCLRWKDNLSLTVTVHR